MNWVRIACDIEDDPQVRGMARALGLELSTAVGLMVRVLARMPKHARDGDVAHLDPVTFEDWTDWRGEPGAFAREFVARFVQDGQLRSWEKYNGAAIREADRRAEQQRQRRAKRRKEQERQEAERAAGEKAPGTPPEKKRRGGTPRHAPAATPEPVPDAVPGYAPGDDTQSVFTNETGRDVPALSSNSAGYGPSSEARTPEEMAAARERIAAARALFRAEYARPTPLHPLNRLVPLQ